MPLLERDWVLDSLSSLAADAAAGHGRIVFLSGEAGAGKTTVVRAFLNQLPAETGTLVGACDSMPTPGQLWPLRDLAEHAGPDLREPVQNGADREALFRGALAELSAAPGATVMAIEDIHWADDATLDLLRFLGRRIEATRGLVIATYRDDNTADMQRLRLVMGDLATTPAMHRIALARLSRDAVGQLAQGHSADVDILYDRTGGNAFFVTEMLAGGTRLPETISDAIAARYARLAPSARSVLDMAAVLGQSVELHTLRTIAGDDENALSDSIESGALIFDGRSVQFRHALVRDAVLAALSAFQRTQLFARAYDAFASGQLPADDARLAHLAEEAGRFDAVPAHARAAADRAAQLRSYREAALQYQRAIRYSAGLSVCERSDLLGGLASVTFYCGSGETDIDILRNLVDTLRVACDTHQMIDSLVWLAWVLDDDGQQVTARRTAEEAVRLAEECGNPESMGAALAALARFHYQAGWLDSSLPMSARALELAKTAGNPRLVLQIEIDLGAALLDFDEAAGVSLLEQCIEDGRMRHYDVEAGHAMTTLGFHWTDVYQIERAERIFDEAIAFTSEHELDCWWRWARVGQSRNALIRGDWLQATALAGSAIQVRSGCFLNRAHAPLTIARIRARRGDPEVDLAIRTAVAACQEDPLPYLACLIGIARTEAAYLAGDHERALQIANETLPLARTFEPRWQIGELGHFIVSSGGAPVAGCEHVGPYRFEQQGDWSAAHAAWLALGAPYEAARAQAMLPDESALREALAVFEQLGAQAMCAIVIRRLRALGVGSVPRGPRNSTKAHPFGLTAREAEILEQLVEGWTNGEIGVRLFLSERTVEHHVSAILAKLGVKSRRDAIRIARELTAAGAQSPELALA